MTSMTFDRTEPAPINAFREANGYARDWLGSGSSTEASVQPASKESTAFLRLLHAASPWAISTFGPGAEDVGPARTFDPSEEDAARKFINEQQGKRNVYFSVNRVGRKLTKKAAKTDIEEVHYLHVDADLSKTLNWSDLDAVDAEKERVLTQLRTYDPPPTAITWSGGGYWGFWRLSEIIVVGGDETLMVPVERRMQHIAQVLGADPCHNADRIARLPGTINVLGKTKLRAGRKPALAELVEFHEDRIYDLEDFPEPEEPRTRSAGTGAGPRCDDNVRDEFQRARDALRAIPPDEYDPYFRIGCALRNGFGDAGFDLYREWSMRSIKFDENEIRRKWISIKPEGGVTIATLFDQALKNGWREQRKYYCGTSTKQDATPLTRPDMGVVQRNQVEVRPFPLDVFGDSAANWVLAAAECKAAPPDYLSLGLLVSAAAIIGPKRRVSPWEEWEEPSILWGALVGPPSFSKSPSTDPFRDAAREIERDLNFNWEERSRKYEEDKKKAEAVRADWEQRVTVAVKAGKSPPAMPPEAILPKPIARRRLWIADATTEKVARILGVNPDGLICFRDELAGLLGGFDKYGGSGGDRAFWLEAYGGRSYRYDRVSLKDESIDIPFCAVSLLGGLQPDRLNTMILSGDDDGLASRPLYAWPNPVRARRPVKKPDNDALLAALRRLSRLEFDVDPIDESVRARRVPLTFDAADEFSAWCQKTQWDAKFLATGRIAGAIGKLDGIVLRIAQVLEFLAWAWGQSNAPEPAQVSLLSVMRAIRIIEEWVRPNLERVFAEASMPKAQRDAMTVGRWLLKTKPDNIVNARELRRQPGFPGPKHTKELDEALQILVEARWLEPVPEDRPGRPRKDYAINPAVFEASTGK